MKLVIIGHRGVGKSTLAKRLKEYFQMQNHKISIYDLDAEIVSQNKKTIDQIFFSHGESHFRKLERSTFDQLRGEDDVVIIAGAGFEPRETAGLEFLWVQRPTDEQGRIFTDRPRLDSGVTPLREFLSRFKEREKKYASLSHEVLILGEGFDFSNSAEEKYFTSQVKEVGGIWTVFARHLDRLREKLSWGIDLFELRDDLLSQSEIVQALEILPNDKVLISFRETERISQTRTLVEKLNFKFDWPVDYPKCDWANPFIISLHGDDTSQILRAESDFPQALIKWACDTNNFHALMLGHAWQKENPERRSFLPMSQKGIWKWYRLWNSQPLSFFRIDRGSAADQPSLLERLRQNEFINPKNFAAVLGDPVLHSRSPAEHFDFFKKQDKPFYAVQVMASEFQFALAALEELGLTEAAVTSPLKELAFQNSQPNQLSILEIAATNTLILNRSKQWIGTNTDIEGVKAIAKGIPHLDEKSVAIWGGGGTLGVLKKVFPNALYYSSRTGEPRSPIDRLPKILIWAVGRKNFDQAKVFPPSEWPIEMIIDLNYSEDSPGRECALRYGCPYISGLEMFRVQAQAQRQFWSQFS